MKFPLIEAMGLKVYAFKKSPNVRPCSCEIEDDHSWVGVSAPDLETALEGAIEVKQHNSALEVGGWFSEDVEPNPTHTARLVCIQPIMNESGKPKLKSWKDFARVGKKYDEIFNDFMNHLEEVARASMKEIKEE